MDASVVIPCLDEADTLEACIVKAKRGLALAGIEGEVVVADNGSTDGSANIALRLGARVVQVPQKGYGNALRGGIEAAKGQLIIMGDADDSYDFLEVPALLAKLREGFDLVQGCRLPSGGGRIAPGAMPFSHRWVGNPILSLLARRMFRTPVHDIYCGLRGFSKELYERLDLRCTGMEFATEMIIKASLRGARIAQVPITLHRDGRVAHARHLSTFRDGWRTLRLFLLLSPKWLFWIPGWLLVLFGLAGTAVALPGLRFKGVTFDAHTLLFSSLAILVGYQSMLFAILVKTFAVNRGLAPEDAWFRGFYRAMNLERGLALGGGALVVGGSLMAVVVFEWWLTGFGNLDYPRTMRWVIPGVTLAALGAQTIWSSFFASILGLELRR